MIIIESLFKSVDLQYEASKDVKGPQAVRHLWEAGRLGLGETDQEKMDFPAMSLQEAIGAFTEAAYGKRLTFEHA